MRFEQEVDQLMRSFVFCAPIRNDEVVDPESRAFFGNDVLDFSARLAPRLERIADVSVRDGSFAVHERHHRLGGESLHARANLEKQFFGLLQLSRIFRIEAETLRLERGTDRFANVVQKRDFAGEIRIAEKILPARDLSLIKGAIDRDAGRAEVIRHGVLVGRIELSFRDSANRAI